MTRLIPFVTCVAFLSLCAAPAWADDEAGYLGVQVRYDRDAGGIYIIAVQDDTAAAKAGIQQDSVIKKVNGKEFTDVQSFVDEIRMYKVGEEVTLVIQKNGEAKEVKVKLGKFPKQ